MEAELRIVFNRSDCPYGCGAELPNLRWQRTPCPRCGRPIYQLSSVVDEEGRVLWPTASVPRSPEEGQPGVTVQYVVTGMDDRERIELGGDVISRTRAPHGVPASQYLGCLLVVVLLLAGVAWVVNLLARALNLP